MLEPIIRRWLRQIASRYRKHVVLIMLVSATITGCNIAFPLLWKEIVDDAIAGSINYLAVAAFASVLLFEVFPLVFLIRSRFLNRLENNFRGELLAQVLQLSIPFHKARTSTRLLLETDKGAEGAVELTKLLLDGSTLANSLVAVYALYYIAAHSVMAALILVVFVFIFLFASYVLGARVEGAQTAYNDQLHRVSTRSREAMHHIEMVKLNRTEVHEQRWYDQEAVLLLECRDRMTKYYTCFQAIGRVAHVLPHIIVLILFLPSVLDGTLSIGTLIAIQLFSTQAVGPAGYLANQYQEIKTSIAHLKPALALFDKAPTITEAADPLELGPVQDGVELADVTFRYPGVEKPTIDGVSLSIPAGDKVALVGSTGSGKTTLGRLIARLYDPELGVVRIDRRDIRRYSLDSLYAQVGYVSQDVPILSGTIGENVAYGLPNATEEQIEEACRRAAASFVFEKPDGLATQIGELGQKLSGGERQRLALARVFMRQPSLVVLDEATSSLDTATEREVQAAFDNLLEMNGGTTMLVIAHRITTVRNANSIIVLDRGRVADSGTHEELLERCGLYQELCQGMAE